MKIYYLCRWESPKEKTWSGTTYSLFNALKELADVYDIDLHFNLLKKTLLRLTAVRLDEHGINTKNFFSKQISNADEKALNNALKDKKDGVVLQISMFGQCKLPFYSYIDLSADSLIYCQKHYKELFDYSTIEKMNAKAALELANRQALINKEAKGVFTMSKWLADNLVQYSNLPKEKVHYVGAGINVNINNIKDIKKDNNKILFVGKDFLRKGGDLVIEAFNILRKKYMPSAELYIVGPKSFNNKYKDENIKFLGRISPEDVCYYYNICDIFCLPSRFEAYGIVFIEALIYGLPCIARDAFEMKEFIDDSNNGYLVKDDDPEYLANTMFTLLNNKEIKEYVLNNRDEYIKKYSWNTVAKRIISVINKDMMG